MRGSRWILLPVLLLAGLAWFLWGSTRRPRAATGASEVPDAAEEARAVLVGEVGRTGREIAAAQAPEPASSKTEVPASSEVVLAEPVLPGLSGRILELEGGALEGAEVILVDAWARNRDVSVVGGEYSAGELESGHYWLTARADGKRASFGEVELVEGRPERLDLVLAPRVALEVRVLGPDGRPYFEDVDSEGPLGLWAVALPRRLEAWRFELAPGEWTHQDAGEFSPYTERNEEGALGVLELAGDLPIHVGLCRGERVLACESVPVGAREVLLRLDTIEPLALARLVVRVLDSAGKPVADASVLLSSSAGEITHIEAAVEGQATFENQSPGRAQLMVFSDTHGHEVREVLLLPGENEVLVHLGLARRIQGRILGRDPEIDLHTALTLGRLESPAGLPRWEDSIAYGVREDGSFDLEVAPGLYALRVSGGRPVPIALVDLREKSFTDLELATRDHGEVVVQRQRGEWRGVRYEIREESGLVSEHGRLYGPEPVRFALAQGGHRLRCIDALGSVLHDAPFQVGAEPSVVRVGW
jgi:hypothetical protein